MGWKVDQRLGVPLDADEERAGPVLDRLDRAVVGARGDGQPGPQLVHRLAVERVRVQPRTAGYAAELRVERDRDRVRRHGGELALALAVDVLMQRPAAREV